MVSWANASLLPSPLSIGSAVFARLLLLLLLLLGPTTTKQRLLCFRFVRTYACTAVFLCCYRFWIVSMHMQTNKKTCTHQKHQKTANFIDNYEEHISNMSFWSGWSGNVYSILLDACFLIAIGQSAHHHAVQVTDSGECAIVRLSA